MYLLLAHDATMSLYKCASMRSLTTSSNTEVIETKEQ